MYMSHNYKNKISVTTGIAAYNAEKNISSLLISLINQTELDYKLDRIVVYSDSSSDKTDAIVKKIKNNKVILQTSKQRQGFAGAVASLLKQNSSDVTVLLNDDIIIKDSLFLNKLTDPFRNNSKVGLVCGNIQPYKPISFIEKAIESGFKAYDKTRKEIKNGNTILTCDGKSMALSKKFISSIVFPVNRKELGNVDGYLYFLCLNKGFKYRYAKNAILYFRFPSTIEDFIKWTIRNTRTKDVFQSVFGERMTREYRLPFLKFTYNRIIEFIHNPFGSLLIALLGFYSFLTVKVNKKEFNETWDLVKTTKDIKLIND